MRIPGLKGISVIAAMACMAIGVLSCNKKTDEDVQYTYISNSNTAVTAFALSANDSVLKHLNAVFFSIDLDNARIFNARPLPAGTNVSSLSVDITTNDCSVVELDFTTRFGNDTVINYLTNPTDGINFANGNPVTLHVVSHDGAEARDYSLSVNVYEENPDIIHWSLQSASLPFSLDNITSTKTVKGSDGFYMMLEAAGLFYIAKATDIYQSEWAPAAEISSIDFTPVVESFTIAVDGTFYVLSTSNVLYTSVDTGVSWTSTGEGMTHIFGSYGSSIVGCDTEAVTPMASLYTPGEGAVMIQLPEGMPVKGTSNLVVLSSSWEISPLALLSGGVQADGNPTGDTWGFDGTTWMKLNTTALPGVEGRALFNYTIAETDSATWNVTYLPVVMAIGGKSAGGDVNNTLYYSTDMGVHWVTAPEYMQPAEELPALYGTQMFSFDTTLFAPGARAVAPIEQWECPYIYQYGGVDAGGSLNRQIWRGVMNRYTIEPLQ